MNIEIFVTENILKFVDTLFISNSVNLSLKIQHQAHIKKSAYRTHSFDIRS